MYTFVIHSLPSHKYTNIVCAKRIPRTQDEPVPEPVDLGQVSTGAATEGGRPPVVQESGQATLQQRKGMGWIGGVEFVYLEIRVATSL